MNRYTGKTNRCRYCKKHFNDFEGRYDYFSSDDLTLTAGPTDINTQFVCHACDKPMQMRSHVLMLLLAIAGLAIALIIGFKLYGP